MQKCALKAAFLCALFLIGGCKIPAFKPIGFSLVWVLVVFLYGTLTIILVAWINKVKNTSPIMFITAVSGTTIAKTLTTLAIITIYVASKQPNSWHFSFGVLALFVGNSTLFVLETNRIIRKG